MLFLGLIHIMRVRSVFVGDTRKARVNLICLNDVDLRRVIKFLINIIAKIIAWHQRDYFCDHGRLRSGVKL